MTRGTGLLSTTHVDAHGEKMALSTLEGMVKQINEGILLINVEHDPRNVPIGRIISARIIQLEDGEFGVEGIFEFFDCKLAELTDLEDRQIVIREFSRDKVTICYDRSFREPDGQRDIEDLCTILDTNIRISEVRKALEPIVILAIGGSFILGSIASGFFGSIGEDVYILLKRKLGEISLKKQRDHEEFILIFEFTVINLEMKYNVEVILTNPAEEDIELAIRTFSRLDEILPILFAKYPEAKKIVFEYCDGALALKYGLDNKGIPISFNFE
jgi:hypothetical protein